MARESGFITAYRQQVVDLLDRLEELIALKAEYVALDYAVELVDADFVDDNDDITAADFNAAVATVEVITSTLSGTDHEANLYRLKG